MPGKMSRFGMLLLSILVLLGFAVIFEFYMGWGEVYGLVASVKGLVLPMALSAFIVISALILRYISLLLLEYLMQGYPPDLIRLSKTIATWIVLALTIIFVLAVFADRLVILLVLGAFLLTILISSRKFVEDYLVRLQLLLSPQINIGDTIMIDGTMGKVSEFGLLHTSIKCEDGRMLLIPNKDIISTRIYNLSRAPLLKVQDVLELEVDKKEAQEVAQEIEASLLQQGFANTRMSITRAEKAFRITAVVVVEDPVQVQKASTALTKVLKGIASRY